MLSMLSEELLNTLYYIERKSDELMVPRIGRDDGIAIYSVLYMLASGREKLVAIDAGAGIGYSTLWLLIALESVCINGHLYAIERAKNRFSMLKNTLDSLPLRCTKAFTVHGDAIEYIQREFGEDSIDFIFIDIDKSRYIEIFNVIKKKIRRNGIATYHNAYMVRGVITTIVREAQKEGWSSTIIPTDEGILLLRRP